MTFRFLSTCIGWDPQDVNTPGGLVALIDAKRPISRRSFLRHIDRAELASIEAGLCYCAHPAQGLTMAGDWHVSYWVSRLHGRKAYGFDHSAIEYVFVEASPC